MSESFFNYLQRERCRLEEQLATALSTGLADHKIVRLEQLRGIVDNQFERWSRDLSDRIAA